jgi:hypothetical protein
VTHTHTHTHTHTCTHTHTHTYTHIHTHAQVTRELYESQLSCIKGAVSMQPIHCVEMYPMPNVSRGGRVQMCSLSLMLELSRGGGRVKMYSPSLILEMSRYVCVCACVCVCVCVCVCEVVF